LSEVLHAEGQLAQANGLQLEGCEKLVSEFDGLTVPIFAKQRVARLLWLALTALRRVRLQ
jgi:hypothetical protein